MQSVVAEVQAKKSNKPDVLLGGRGLTDSDDKLATIQIRDNSQFFRDTCLSQLPDESKLYEGYPVLNLN